MSPADTNLAVTQNGEQYNKLKRPDDYLSSTTKPVLAQDGLGASAAPKRTLDEANNHENTHEAPHFKRARRLEAQNEYGQSSIPGPAIVRRPFNPMYGMQSVFPGMVEDDEASDESTNEALEYLRSVRSEAESIPQLLVAAPQPADDVKPDRFIYDYGTGDQRAVYVDGTWIARDPDRSVYASETLSTSLEDLEPQEGYYKKLLWRYQSMRKMLQNPPVSQSEKVQADPSTRMASQIPRNRHEWLYVIDREYPSPALLGQLREHEVLRGIDNCANSLERFRSITKQQSCWIWALLAKAPDAGTLNYTIAGRIRNLGHKAGQFGVKLRSGVGRVAEFDREEEEVDETGEEHWAIDNEDVEDTIDLSDGEESLGAASLQKLLSDTGPQQKEERIKLNDASQHDENIQQLEPLVDGGNQRSALDVSDTQEKAMLQGGTSKPSITPVSPPDQEGSTAINKPLAVMNARGVESGEKTSVSDDEHITLEQARARLLAQLGDRLVQPRAIQASSTSTVKSQNTLQAHSPSSTRVRRHRHNGKWCHGTTCAPSNWSDRRRTSHQKAGHNGSKNLSPSKKVPRLPSDDEIEAQRLRDQKLRIGEGQAQAFSEPAHSLSDSQLEPGMHGSDTTQTKTCSETKSGKEEEIQPSQSEGVELEEPEVKTTVEADIPDLNSRVTIDMILTVVAECYGQKDLLKFRDVWV